MMKLNISVFIDDNKVPQKIGLSDHLGNYREFTLEQWYLFPLNLYIDGLSQKYLDKDGRYQRKIKVETNWEFKNYA